MYGGGQGHLIFILSLKTNAPRPPPSTGHVESVGTLEEWINYRGFLELRLCPCYNLMPRDLFENMNCIEGAYTLSQQYLHCQAVDNAALAAVWPGGITSVRAPCSPPLPVLPTSTVSLCTCYCVGGRGVEPPRDAFGSSSRPCLAGCFSKCHQTGTCHKSRTGRAAWTQRSPRLTVDAMSPSLIRVACSAKSLTTPRSPHTIWGPDRASIRRHPPMTSSTRWRGPASPCLRLALPQPTPQQGGTPAKSAARAWAKAAARAWAKAAARAWAKVAAKAWAKAAARAWAKAAAAARAGAGKAKVAR